MEVNSNPAPLTEIDPTGTQQTMDDSFENYNLSHDLLKGIISYGFQRPSKIQQQTLLPMAQGRDILAQAQSGTGKTSMFAMGILQRVNPQFRETQALVLNPTRELAMQTHQTIKGLGYYLSVTSHTVVGGKSMFEDMKQLDNGVQVISGTPGRVYDMLKRRCLHTKNILVIVIDEADEMLTRGFKEQVYECFRFMPASVQVILVSATLPAEIVDMASKFLTEPVKVLVRRDELTLDEIKQYCLPVEGEEMKYSALKDLYECLYTSHSVIFLNTRKRVDWLGLKLKRDNFSVSMIHGEMPQAERDIIVKDFRDGVTRVLLTTDVLSRGIDIEQVTLVVNFDLPKSRELYIHRIGRTGRFTKKGIAINFVTGQDQVQILRDIEQFYNTKIEEMPVMRM
ncbi:DEAD box RNA helicase RH2a [Perkinsela sp. CCAP 1560/4]|nr:DEAD box RNA helicase RH2a [Perkinsela sp. CCAP 1560/4]|eukprot:KNH07613.1 DEAD box RNA helicase RH2a [Perkinsela sp. CCAP 1560/4]